MFYYSLLSLFRISYFLNQSVPLSFFNQSVPLPVQTLFRKMEASAWKNVDTQIRIQAK